MSTFSFLYKELSEELINSARNVDSLTEYIKSRNSGVTDEDVAYVKRNISQRFLPLFNKRWFAATQNIARFFASNSVWLTSEFSGNKCNKLSYYLFVIFKMHLK